ncbi:MAG TPA: sensor histidine kinase, partial [Epsilonproteobacteria bacterium]|nr:sensor histidine kinase [Campylobacterota bacterium]
MPKNRPSHRTNQLFVTLIYLLSVLLLLAVLYGFLSANGFARETFLIGAGVLSLAAFGLGYILSGDLLTPKWEMDERFAHLSREILH